MKMTIAALLVSVHCNVACAIALPVVIEKLNEAAEKCGLSESQLEGVVLRTEESNQLGVDTDAVGWLHVYVEVRQTRRNSCAAHIAVQMKASAGPLPKAEIATPKQRSRVSDIVLCDVGGDYTAPRAAFSLEIESAAEQFVTDCLGSLKH